MNSIVLNIYFSDFSKHGYKFSRYEYVSFYYLNYCFFYLLKKKNRKKLISKTVYPVVMVFIEIIVFICNKYYVLRN